MLLSVDQRIAVSMRLRDRTPGMRSGPLRVVRNGITPRTPTRGRDEVRAELGVGPDDPVMLMVARFTPQKAHDFLLAAVPGDISYPRARFLLVGTGPEFDTVTAAVEAEELGGCVSLLGARADVPNLLAAADLSLHPSRFEGLSLSLLEAMAAGVPAVATDIRRRAGGTGRRLSAARNRGRPASVCRGGGGSATRSRAAPRCYRGGSGALPHELHCRADGAADRRNLRRMSSPSTSA